MAAFPPALPPPRFEGYALAPVDGTLRTQPQSGQARQRQQFTNTPTGVTVSWRFTASELTMFRSWVRHKAQGGAAFFTVPLVFDAEPVMVEAQFLGEGGQLYRVAARRASGPGGGPLWIVSARLQVRDVPVLSEAVLDVLLTENPDGLLSAFAGLHALVHTVMPGVDRPGLLWLWHGPGVTIVSTVRLDLGGPGVVVLSAPFSEQARRVMLVANVPCHIALGVSPAVDTAGKPLAANTHLALTLDGGERLAAVPSAFSAGEAGSVWASVYV